MNGERTVCRFVGGLVLLLVTGAPWILAQATGTGSPATSPAAPTQASATEQGVALFKQRRYADAKKALSQAVAADGKDALALAYLGMTLYNFDRDADQGIARLEEAVKLEPQRSQFHQWLGGVYGGKAGNSGIFKGAYYAKKCLEEFEKGVELDPKDPEARESLLQYYLMAPAMAGGSMDKAKEQAETLTKLDACRGLVSQAAIAQREKDLKRAESLYREAVAAAPSKGLPYNALGYYLLGEKRTAEAVEVFRKYVQVAPADANAHDSLAEGLLEQGKGEESLAEYGKAVEIDPYFSSSWLGLAQCYERKGDVRQAREAGMRYLELVPKGRTSDQVRKKLQEPAKKG